MSHRMLRAALRPTMSSKQSEVCTGHASVPVAAAAMVGLRFP